MSQLNIHFRSDDFWTVNEMKRISAIMSTNPIPCVKSSDLKKREKTHKNVNKSTIGSCVIFEFIFFFSNTRNFIDEWDSFMGNFETMFNVMFRFDRFVLPTVFAFMLHLVMFVKIYYIRNFLKCFPSVDDYVHGTLQPCVVDQFSSF